MKIEGITEIQSTLLPERSSAPEKESEERAAQDARGTSAEGPAKATVPAGDAVADVQDLIDDLGLKIQIRDLRLQFDVDSETNNIVVRVLDAETEEVIRQVPPEEFVRFSRKLDELIGVLFDEKI